MQPLKLKQYTEKIERKGIHSVKNTFFVVVKLQIYKKYLLLI